ncbi:MAG: hypothetical protein AABX53_00875 [Nanoarchaeota archaeon]
MKRGAVVLYLLFFFVPLATATSIDPTIQRITHYAEEYETGNIDYAQLIVHMSSLRAELAEAMGALSQGHDAVLTEQQLGSALGEPRERTKWVWVEGEDREKKVDNEVPAWKKILFDGKTIQIWLNAWPSISVRDGEDALVYRLHNDVQFKQVEDDFDIADEIETVTELAERYSVNLDENVLERLAEESVNVEQLFNSHFNQNPAQCGELMNGLFGSENKRESQQVLVEEITLFEADRSEAKIRLEMCDDCNWHWIGLNMWVESRHGFNGQGQDNTMSRARYDGLGSAEYQSQTRAMVVEIRSLLEAGDFSGAQSRANDLRALTEAWNQAANNVWEQFEGSEYQVDFSTMTPEAQEECSRTYCWIKKNQERAQAQQALITSNYEERKAFYLELFAPYEKKEQSFTQEQWEKQLVRSFVEAGQETCDNNQDDNRDGAIDCADAQCGGQVCGYGAVEVTDENNTTSQQEVALYCISNMCRQREEVVVDAGPVCGNHICEEGESGDVNLAEESDTPMACEMDCVQCVVFEPLVCEGSVIFSGNDINGCPLTPVCIGETTYCTFDADCTPPLCGVAACVEGTCQTTTLEECREAECAADEERVQACENGDQIISSICGGGVWVETGVACTEGAVAEETRGVEEVVTRACVVRSDCGGEHDVCSNGQCVTLPEVVEEAGVDEEIVDGEESENVEETEIEASTESADNAAEPEPSQDSSEGARESSEVTGNVIFSFFRAFANRMTTTARAVEGEGEDGGEESSESDSDEGSGGENPDSSGESTTIGQGSEGGEGSFQENQQPDDDFDDERLREEDDRENREQEDRDRRENECKERCDRECYDMNVRPSVEKCIFETCGENFECNLDDVRVTCESSASGESNLESCARDCIDTCMAGENTWRESERKEHKLEKFVFGVGGACRKEQGKEGGNIWFNAWGQDLQDFQQIKNKYFLGDGGGDWCARELQNLLRQRAELEKSLNKEFAAWFFEQYVANAADDWQNHMSGIFEIYWRDVDISRQIAERQRCLGQSEVLSSNLITFTYETEYGSVEFWEEIKSAQLGDDDGEQQLISPYMKLWLFPSRDFFVREMQTAMEQHRMPGPAEEQGDKKGGLSARDREELSTDDDIMSFVREFNAQYGDSLAVQFKNVETAEIMFNVYVRLNEEEIVYFEPMPLEEMSEVDVTITLDSEKLLDMIEYSESGRVELQSPPWDRKPDVGGITGVVSGAQMYLKMRALMGSIAVTPAAAEGDAKRFMKDFFDIVMGDDRGGPEGQDEEKGDEREGELQEGSEGFDDKGFDDSSDERR